MHERRGRAGRAASSWIRAKSTSLLAAARCIAAALPEPTRVRLIAADAVFAPSAPDRAAWVPLGDLIAVQGLAVDVHQRAIRSASSSDHERLHLPRLLRHIAFVRAVDAWRYRGAASPSNTARGPTRLGRSPVPRRRAAARRASLDVAVSVPRPSSAILRRRRRFIALPARRCSIRRQPRGKPLVRDSGDQSRDARGRCSTSMPRSPHRCGRHGSSPTSSVHRQMSSPSSGSARCHGGCPARSRVGHGRRRHRLAGQCVGRSRESMPVDDRRRALVFLEAMPRGRSLLLLVEDWQLAMSRASWPGRPDASSVRRQQARFAAVKHGCARATLTARLRLFAYHGADRVEMSTIGDCGLLGDGSHRLRPKSSCDRRIACADERCPGIHTVVIQSCAPKAGRCGAASHVRPAGCQHGANAPVRMSSRAGSETIGGGPASRGAAGARCVSSGSARP